MKSMSSKAGGLKKNTRQTASATDLRKQTTAKQSKIGGAMLDADSPRSPKDAQSKKMMASKSSPQLGGFAMSKQPPKQPESVGEATRLARKFYLDLYEVKDIMKLFKDCDTNGSGGIDKEEFEQVMVAVLGLLDTDGLDKSVFENAWKDMQGRDGDSGGAASGNCMWEASLDNFFEWYTRNMFSQVCQQTITDDMRVTYQIAKDNDVTVPVIDKLQKRFDFFDEDGSGEIDYGEFLNMLCLVLKCKSVEDISEDRVKRFWKEIDIDGSGGVTFEEFCKWYLKYFNPDEDLEDGSGPIGQFYASFNQTEKETKQGAKFL